MSGQSRLLSRVRRSRDRREPYTMAGGNGGGQIGGAVFNAQKVHSGLRGPWEDEESLKADLRYVCEIPEWDNASLTTTLTALYLQRLVVRAADGRLVKGEPPRELSPAEQVRQAAEAAGKEQRDRRIKAEAAQRAHARQAREAAEERGYRELYPVMARMLVAFGLVTEEQVREHAPGPEPGIHIGFPPAVEPVGRP